LSASFNIIKSAKNNSGRREVMLQRKKAWGFLLAGSLGMFFLESCATFQDLAGVLANLRRLEFKLSRVQSFSLAGITIGGKSGLTDFSAGEGITLFQGFQDKRLPAEVVVDILIRNPNDGTGGSTKTVSTLTGLESRLLINGNPTVYGNIDSPIEIPGTGQATTVPLRFSIDLYEFFGTEGYEGILNMALAIGGLKGSVSRLSLDAQPTVTTPLGVITYPGRIMIVDREFR
jgi:hypothetical protein